MKDPLTIIAAIMVTLLLIGGIWAWIDNMPNTSSTTHSTATPADEKVPEGAIRLLSGIEYHSNALDAVSGRNPTVLTKVVYVYVDGYAFVRNGKILESRCTPGEKIDNIPVPPTGATVVYHVHTVDNRRLGWVHERYLT